MFDKFCISCGMPLMEESKHASEENYCKYCADESGKLQPREGVQAGIAEWLKQNAPETEGVDFMKRADFYLKAMPAWAE